MSSLGAQVSEGRPRVLKAVCLIFLCLRAEMEIRQVQSQTAHSIILIFAFISAQLSSFSAYVLECTNVCTTCVEVIGPVLAFTFFFLVFKRFVYLL